MSTSREPEETKRFRGELAAQKRAEGQIAILEAQKVADAEKRIAEQQHAQELVRIKEQSALALEAIKVAAKAAEKTRRDHERAESNTKRQEQQTAKLQTKQKSDEEKKAQKSIAEEQKKAQKAVLDVERAQRAATRKTEQESRKKAYKAEQETIRQQQMQTATGMMAQRDLLRDIGQQLPEHVGAGLNAAINTVKTLRGMGAGSSGLGGFAVGAAGVLSIGSAILGQIGASATAQKQLNIDALGYQRIWGGNVDEMKTFARDASHVGKYLGEGGAEFTQQLLAWSKVNEGNFKDAKGYVEMMQNAAEPQNMGLDNAMKLHDVFAGLRAQATANPYGMFRTNAMALRSQFANSGFQTLGVSEHAPEEAKRLSNGGKLGAYDIAMRMTGLDKKFNSATGMGGITQQDLDNLQTTLLAITKNVDTPAGAKMETPQEKLQRQFDEMVSGLMPLLNQMAGGVMQLVNKIVGTPNTDRTSTEGGKATFGDAIAGVMSGLAGGATTFVPGLNLGLRAMGGILPGANEATGMLNYGGRNVSGWQTAANWYNGEGVTHGAGEYKGGPQAQQKTENNVNVGGVTINVDAGVDSDLPNVLKKATQDGIEAGTSNLTGASGGPK